MGWLWMNRGGMELISLPPEILCRIVRNMDPLSSRGFASTCRAALSLFNTCRPYLIKIACAEGAAFVCDLCARAFPIADRIIKNTLYESSGGLFEGPLGVCGRCQIPLRRRSMRIANTVARNYIEALPRGEKYNIARSCEGRYRRCKRRPLACDEEYMRSRALKIYLS